MKTSIKYALAKLIGSVILRYMHADITRHSWFDRCQTTGLLPRRGAAILMKRYSEFIKVLYAIECFRNYGHVPLVCICIYANA